MAGQIDRYFPIKIVMQIPSTGQMLLELLLI